MSSNKLQSKGREKLNNKLNNWIITKKCEATAFFPEY